jgi:hypothetical protein
MLEMTIDTSGLKRLERSLLDAVGEKARRTAISLALTRVAVKARTEVTRRLPQIFYHPTPFTMQSVR